MARDPIIDIAVDPEDMATRAAIWLTTRIVASADRFAISLAGGSTPKRVYELLATPAYSSYIDWTKVHLFWGDERCVPLDHADSNYRMVQEALIAHVPIPPENVHGVPVSAPTPQEAAALYEKELKAYYGAEAFDPAKPLFDVMLLGMGPDGHTASLFPGTEALNEKSAWTTSIIDAKKPPPERVTLTFPAIEASAAILFLVAGADKREALAGALAKDPALPAARIETEAPVLWFIDKAAASAEG